MVTRYTDPVGRETLLEYDTNEIDRLNVKQKNPESPSGYDLLTTYTNNSNHQPLTVTDAAGQTTTYTYNTDGQLATITTPQRSGITEDRTTTYTYDEDGYLESIERPLDATTSYTYDSEGRLETVTGSDGYVLTYDYDELDRRTKVTYPDTTFEETVYESLDPVQTRDRLGRWTHRAYDALRRLTVSTDPLGRTVTQQWCSCGSLNALIDANGSTTEWERDIQGRVTKEIRANGSEWLYAYETTTSRLKSRTDPMEQVKTYSYYADNRYQGITYTNEEHETPDVSVTYDPTFNRLATMTDGTGTTTYEYHSIDASPSLGAGRLATVDGPLSNDAITYEYDELGRVKRRVLNGTAVTYDYDALGRTTKETNILGSFSYQHEGVTRRIKKVTYPNGQTSHYAYYSNSGDRRLEEIHHKRADTSTISKFNYTYDAVGNIETWTQQRDANPAKAYDFGYDGADQLRKAVWRTTDATPTVLKRFAFAHDPAGNRTVQQIDDAPALSVYDNMNRLQSETAGGMLWFTGTVSEAATVTIQSQPASVSSENRFERAAQVSSGTNQVVVKALDYSGNERTSTYEVSVSGGSQSFTFDANGNTTGDGTMTFEWDAENRLAAVVQGTTRSEFSYDGKGRRVGIVEKSGGVITEERLLVFCGQKLCEEREDLGATNKRFYTRGVEDEGTAFYYVSDHLRSVRELTDDAGAVRARYDYDLYGSRTKVSGDKESIHSFTDYVEHEPSGLLLAPFRVYSPSLGRWISEDPIGLRGGPNRYSYAAGNPVNFVDPLGFQITTRRGEGPSPNDEEMVVPPGSGAFTWFDNSYDFYPCRLMGSTWGFEVDVTTWIVTKYNDPPDTWLPEERRTLEDHEQEHRDDFEEAFSEEVLNYHFEVDGFCTWEDCEMARAEFRDRWSEYEDQIDQEAQH